MRSNLDEISNGDGIPAMQFVVNHGEQTGKDFLERKKNKIKNTWSGDYSVKNK